MIAQKTRYALRSLLFLAEEQGGVPVQLSRIAETQRVPPKYLELIMLDLRKAGLVKSARGPKGGYQLSRPAADISFGEIVRSMEGPIALVSCASVNFYAPCGDCHDEATCAIRRAFTIMRDQSTAVLDSISLAQGAGWAAANSRAGGAPAAPLEAAAMSTFTIDTSTSRATPSPVPGKRMTAPSIRARKIDGRTEPPIVMLTAYTMRMAQLLDPHCDMLLVGDSLGQVIYGLPSTIPVTMEM